MKQYLYKTPNQDHFAFAAAVPSLVEGIGQLLGGGAPEDRSQIGFQNYLMQKPSLPAYPPADVVVAAFKSVVAGDQLNSIQQTYDPADGIIMHGDWRARVDSTTPLTIRWFKGANEQGVSRSSKSWTAPVIKQSSVLGGLTGGLTGGNITGGFNPIWFGVIALVLFLVWYLVKK